MNTKMLTALALIAGTLSAPALSFAQSNTGLTRAQVRADLVRIEQAGYNPTTADDTHYPADVQAAEAKLAAAHEAGLAENAVGGVAASGSESSAQR